MRRTPRRARQLHAGLAALGSRMNKGTRWKKLTRNDLTTFDDFATDAVLTAMARGGIGRVSGRGHVTIRASEGRTMSVTRNTNAPHTKQNIQADLRRLFPEINGTPHNEESRIMPDLTILPQTDGALAVADEEPFLTCPVTKCDKVFVTEGARYRHVEDDHATCKWPGCDMGPGGTAFVGMNGSAVAGHTNIQHKGNKPWLARAEAVRNGTLKRKPKKTAAAPVKAVKVAAPKPEKVLASVAVAESNEQPEHRGLPTGEVKHKPLTDAAKLREIRKLLGEDPEIKRLRARIAELEAQLELVAEVLHLATPTKKK